MDYRFDVCVFSHVFCFSVLLLVGGGGDIVEGNIVNYKFKFSKSANLRLNSFHRNQKMLPKLLVFQLTCCVLVHSGLFLNQE